VTAKLVDVTDAPASATVPDTVEPTLTRRLLPEVGTLPRAVSASVIGMFTLIRAPTRIPVVVSKRLIGTSVGPTTVDVPAKVLVPTPLRL
jgi:hypothetical protein